ncbi:unnamed protein product, partial [marine sediment metagenome]
DLWMACYTQEEIADREEISQGEVSKSIPNSSIAEWNKSAQPSADHLVDFEIPLYNVWKYKEATGKLKHFGNTEQTIVDNLLYLYTQPFDIVVDPFAGSGSTGDICKKRHRRYWVSDRKVEPEYENNIRQWDITDGLPQIPRWKDVRLVYLDPPYWKQSEGKYSKDSSDLSNMDLDSFNKVLSDLINNFSKKLSIGTHIALIIQPTQWNAPEHKFTDHVGDMLRLVRLSVEMRFSVPYESQQYSAQCVEWAKQNKKCLVLTREIIVWEMK